MTLLFSVTSETMKQKVDMEQETSSNTPIEKTMPSFSKFLTLRDVLQSTYSCFYIEEKIGHSKRLLQCFPKCFVLSFPALHEASKFPHNFPEISFSSQVVVLDNKSYLFIQQTFNESTLDARHGTRPQRYKTR